MPSGLKHGLKQGMKILGVLVNGNGIGWLLIDLPLYFYLSGSFAVTFKNEHVLHCNSSLEANKS